MKRMVITALALCLLLSGCGKKETTTPAVPSVPQNPEQNAESQTPTVPEVPTLPGVLQVVVGEEVRSEYTDDTALVKTKWPVVALAEEQQEQYPALAKALDQYTVERYKEGLQNFELIKDAAYEMYADSPEIFEFMTFTSESSALVTRADEHALSFAVQNSEFWGGAHPFGGWYAVTLDPETGAYLELDDVIPNQDGLYDLIIDSILQFSDGFERETLEEVFANDAYPDSLTWSLGYDHMMFYFSDYELGSYAQGAPCVPVSFRALEGMMDPRFTEVPEAYAVPMDSLWQHYVYADLQEDGIMHEVGAYGLYGEDKYDNDYDCFGALAVGIDEREVCTKEDLYIYSVRSYLIRTADGWFIYMPAEEMEISCVYCIRLNAQDLTAEFLEEEISGSIEGQFLLKDHYGISHDEPWDDGISAIRQITDPNHFCLTLPTYALGTNIAHSWYRVTRDGLAELENGCYTFEYDPDFGLTLLQNIAFEQIDPETMESIGSADLKAGTYLSMIRSDDETFADLQSNTGEVYRVRLSYGDAICAMVNGIPSDELFDGVYYG